MRPERTGPGRPGLLLAAIAITAFNLRAPVTGFAVLTTVTGSSLGFGPVVTGAIGTIVTGCFAAAAFVTPRLARRLGLERAAAVAVAAATIGIVVRALAWSPGALVAGTVIAMAGIGGANVILIPVVKEHFPGFEKSISTLYMVLLQVGQLVAPLVAVALLGPFGWRVAAGAWSVLTGIASVLWFSALRRQRDPGPDRAEAVSEFPTDMTRPAWRMPLFWGLAGLMAMTTLHTYTLFTWLPTMYQDAGLSAAAGASLLACFSSLGILAAFLVPPLALHTGRRSDMGCACAALMAVGYSGMAFDPAGGALVWALAFGLGVSTFPLCLTLIGARAVGSGMSATLSGTIQGIGYGVGCIGPITLGALNDATHSWLSAYAVLGATLVVTLVAGWLACRPTGTTGRARPSAPAAP